MGVGICLFAIFTFCILYAIFTWKTISDNPDVSISIPKVLITLFFCILLITIYFISIWVKK